MRPPFRNEPELDFRCEDNREAMRAALARVKDQLGGEYPLLINGEPVVTGQWITSLAPADPELVVGKAAKAGLGELEQALAAAEGAFPAWSRLPVEERASVLFRLAGLLRQRRLELAAWLVYELDKAWDEADGEIAEAVDFLEWYGRQALKLAEPRELAHLPGEATTFQYLPLGVGAIIPPWNFPCAIFTGLVSAAIVVGNTVVVKPASNTPIIAAKLIEIFTEAGVPAGVVNFLPGSGSELGDALATHPKVRFLSFIGSRDVGIKLYGKMAQVQPGQRFIRRMNAELGGKDAIIVDKDADVAAAVEGIVTSAFGFQGQKCSACSRAIVHQDVYDAVVAGVVERTRAHVTVGPATEGRATVGAVVDQHQYAAIRDYIEVGKREGRLVYQGEGVPETGYYIPPTIFADVPADARIACEEIFGPVLAIVKARDFDDALRIANDSDYGLTGSVYSRNRYVLEQARREFQVGNLYLNRKCTGALVGVHPFGGVKLSGAGSKPGGPDYLLSFVEAKATGEQLFGPTPSGE